MNKERIRRMVAAVAIGFSAGFVTDKIINNPISVPVRHETPVAVLPEPLVIFSSLKRAIKQ